MDKTHMFDKNMSVSKKTRASGKPETPKKWSLGTPNDIELSFILVNTALLLININ